MATKKKKVQKPIKVFTLDTETRGLFGDIFRVGMYDGNRYFAANTFKEIKNILSKYTTKYDCHVFIHNLDFDLSKMAKELIPTSKLDKSIFINNNVTVFQASVTTTQHTEENEIISQPITFHDSNKLIMGRLKNICKDFKLDVEESKIELKDHIINLGWGKNRHGEPIKDVSEYDDFESEGYYFTHVDPWEKQLNEYLRMDCVSLYKVVQTLIEISGLNIYEFLMCPTTASLAMKVFKSNYPEDYALATSTNYFGDRGRMIEKYIRESYCGGRTEVFQPLLLNGWHYDVNSLYPYAMKNFAVPYGQAQYHEGDNARELFKYWFNFGQGAGFLECNIYVPDALLIPPLPLKRFNKLIFPTGNLKGIWTFEEIKLALEMGCVIDTIHSCVYFDKTEKIFKDFISYFEEIKINSDGAKRTFSKLMQNSLYGKFGMRRVRATLLPYEEIEKCEQRYNEHGLRYMVLENPLIEGEKFIEAEIESKADYIQPHIAAYITSYARITLYRGLMAQYDKGDVVYCDTDSIACSEPMDEDMVDDKEYGKWKLEDRIEEGIFLQPKTYFERNDKGHETKKFKGIPARKMDDVTYETYKDILNELQHLQQRMENGETILKGEGYYPLYKTPQESRVKFATTLKMGKTDFDEKVEIMKGINLTNMQKRDMDYINNSSKPHKLMEWGHEYDQLQAQIVEQEMRKEYEQLNKETNVLKDAIKKIGFIKCITQDENYHYEYKKLTAGQRLKYFRTKGIPLDVWCEQAGINENELFELI